MHERDNNLRSKNSNARVSQASVRFTFENNAKQMLIVNKSLIYRWAAYGDYVYLPVQRWLHNIEHGSIVALYHPCANKNLTNRLKKLVKGCLYRHVITTYKKLKHERPFALVAWGTTLEFSVIDDSMLINFIKSYAKTAPEKTSRNGQYKNMLTEPSKIVTDVDDFELCPDKKTWHDVYNLYIIVK